MSLSLSQAGSQNSRTAYSSSCPNHEPLFRCWWRFAQHSKALPLLLQWIPLQLSHLVLLPCRLNHQILKGIKDLSSSLVWFPYLLQADFLPSVLSSLWWWFALNTSMQHFGVELFEDLFSVKAYLLLFQASGRYGVLNLLDWVTIVCSILAS